jgi:hypothetical protein
MKHRNCPMKKIITSFIALGFVFNLMAQRIDINTLSLEQLNLYKAKAVKLRNTGMALSLTGAAALGIGVAILENADTIYSESNITVLGVTSLIFYTCELIGIPLWITGGARKYKANIGLKRFDIEKGNAMALGFGVTLRF